MPSPESLENRQQLLVVHIVVEFSARQGACVKCNRANLAVVSPKGKYPGDCIVGGVSLDYWRECGVEMMEYRCRDERLLEQVEGFVAGGAPVSRGVLACQAHKRDRNLREVGNKATIKVSEPKERLNIFDFPGDRPIPYDLDFRFVHAETVRADNEA